MSFRTQDDAKLLLAFLKWYDAQTDGGTDTEIVERFITEREAQSRLLHICFHVLA